MADGTVIKEWGDGTKQTVNPDGSVDIQYPDGNTQHIPGGSEEAEPYVSSSEAPAPGEEPAAEPAEPEEPGGGGGEGEEGSCFPAGTLVATEGSFISISLVRTGDVLPGYNLVTRQVEMLTVTKTILTENQPLLLLEFGNGSVMSTPTQPFYASAWTRAKDLKAGNQVLCRDGHWEVLMKDPVSAGGADVYNLQVSPSHSYYVGTMQLLVHNKMDVYESGGDESGGGDEFDPRWWDEDEAD
jgi:hypothetical protein